MLRALRLLVRIGLALVTNAIALLLAAALLDGVHIDATSFVVAVIIFSAASLLIRPILAWIVIRAMRPLVGVIALITTFGLLLITDLLSDGFNIDGWTDWILATVIVWLATVVFDIVNDRLIRMTMRRVRPGPA